MKLPYKPKKTHTDFKEIRYRWKIEPKLKVSLLQERVKILTLPTDDGNSASYIHIDPKVQQMGRFTKYWTEFYAGTGIHEINVCVYFNENEEATFFGAGLANYNDGHSGDYLFVHSEAFVKQLAELFSINLKLEE